MTEPALKRYWDTPFNPATELHALDVFTGDGVLDTFTLIFKNGLQVGQSVQVEGTLYPFFNGQAILDGLDVILATPPATGDKAIVPGQGSLVFPVSDQNDTLGRVATIPLYFADIATPHLYRYKTVPGEAGIRLQFVNKNSTAAGAQASWFQLAPALPDGSMGTLLAGGAALYTPDMVGSDTLASTANISDGTITLNDASTFEEGDFVMIDQGLVSQETVKISTIAGNVLTVPYTIGVTHSAGASVLSVGRKFYARVTIPLNATLGNPQNWYNVGLSTYVREVATP